MKFKILFPPPSDSYYVHYTKVEDVEFDEIFTFDINLGLNEVKLKKELDILQVGGTWINDEGVVIERTE